MKIEAGKYYRTRGGDVVGPMRPRFDNSTYCWETSTESWDATGSCRGYEEHDNDLISEVYVRDPPPADGTNKILSCTFGTYASETKTLRDEFAMAALTGMLSLIHI